MGKIFATTSAFLIVLYMMDYKSWLYGSISFVVHPHSPLMLVFMFNFLGIIWVFAKAYEYKKYGKINEKFLYMKLSLYMIALTLAIVLYELSW